MEVIRLYTCTYLCRWAVPGTAAGYVFGLGNEVVPIEYTYIRVLYKQTHISVELHPNI
jgi:hypothetical protein